MFLVLKTIFVHSYKISGKLPITKSDITKIALCNMYFSSNNSGIKNIFLNEHLRKVPANFLQMKTHGFNLKTLF